MLEGAGIPVRVLKGATAAMLAFGRYGVRYSMDIDLIVAKDQVAHAASLLDARGYVRIAPAADASAATMRARMARYKDLAFENPDPGLMVELHWRLFQNPYLLRGDDLDAREPMQLVPGASVAVLPRTPAILYLFAHGTEHGWARLKWLADIGAIIAAETPADLDQFYARAQKRGAARLVAAGLILSHALYETALPGASRDDLAHDWRLRSLVRTAYASLIGDEDGRELEQVAHATTRKNLSHYLISRDPRFVVHELRYDLLDRSAEGLKGGSRLGRVSRRLWALSGGRRHAQNG
ncbi:nucleotidyltransferase family protein [Sphingomonas aerolata]|uniref:nucleotidyltransferase family protein n=1 Tax=Sphingomonas aerolata TaxID=185951 RepID=UPI002FE2DD18